MIITYIYRDEGDSDALNWLYIEFEISIIDGGYLIQGVKEKGMLSEARTFDECRSNIEDLVRGWFEAFPNERERFKVKEDNMK